MKSCEVEVYVNGIQRLCISNDHLSGCDGIDKYREEIIAAGKNLLAFIGYDLNSMDGGDK